MHECTDCVLLCGVSDVQAGSALDLIPSLLLHVVCMHDHDLVGLEVRGGGLIPASTHKEGLTPPATAQLARAAL